MKKSLLFCIYMNLVCSLLYAQAKQDSITTFARRTFDIATLDTSITANRNLAKVFFLCNCVARANGEKAYKNSKDESSSYYFDVLGNLSGYPLSTIEAILEYSNTFAKDVFRSKSKFKFAQCYKHYQSIELDDFIIRQDSSLRLTKRQVKK